jgi:gluconokinase
LTIGTSLAVRRAVSRPVTNPATRVFCYVLGPERFIAGAASNSGGASLEWLYHNLLARWAAHGATAGDLPGALEEASRAHAEGLIFLPYIAGERAPLWSAETSGALAGLRAAHTAADALRAAVEGVLFNAAWLTEQVVENTTPPEAIIATGGVFQSVWIAQLAADILGLPVIPAGGVDASARGAALVADIAAGARTWEQAEKAAGAALAGDARVAPHMAETARHRQRFPAFRQWAHALAVSHPEAG